MQVQSSKESELPLYAVLSLDRHSLSAASVRAPQMRYSKILTEAVEDI